MRFSHCKEGFITPLLGNVIFSFCQEEESTLTRQGKDFVLKMENAKIAFFEVLGVCKEEFGMA